MLKYFINSFVSSMLLFQTNYAFAKIMETSDVYLIREEMLKFTPDDLITFDVKGVIYTPEDHILSPKHVPKFKQKLREIADERGHDEAHRLESIVLSSYEPVLVDVALPGIITEAKNNGIKIIALTSGKTGAVGGLKSRENLRLKRLKKLGVDFSSSFAQSEILLDASPYNGVELPPSIYKNGVIFASRRPKGHIIEIFLQKVDFQPKKIMHIDNRLNKILQVESFCKKHNIEFLGIHFTKIYVDADREFNEKVAERKIQILKSEEKWVSDKTAYCMVNSELAPSICSDEFTVDDK